MTKIVDKKFFKFIGIDIDTIEQQIRRIEEICCIKSVCEYSEEKIRYTYFRYLEQLYLCSMPDLPILQSLIRYIGNAYSYDKDIDTAIYMLVGSWCSDWGVSSMGCDTGIPFSIIYNKYGVGRGSTWCKPLQRIFGRENRISLLSSIDSKTRVEKYSYLNMRKLCDEVKDAIADMETEYQQMKSRSTLSLSERKSLSYHSFMSRDGRENLILLDWMLGLSFAEICCVHMNRMCAESRKYAEEIIECLSVVKSCNIRNGLADMILQHDFLKDVNQEEYKQFIDSLKCIVKIANSIYSVSLYHSWFIFERNVGDDTEGIWQDIIMKNDYDVNIPKYDLYSQELYTGICQEKGIISMPKLLKNVPEVQEQKSAIQMLDELYEWIDYKNTTPEALTDEQIEETNEIRSREDDKRGMIKNPKTLNERYIKIQSIIISCQVVGNFPTFF